MAISVRCPNCGRSLQVKESFAGRTGKCPHCASAVAVPPLGEGTAGDADGAAASEGPDRVEAADGTAPPEPPTSSDLGAALSAQDQTLPPAEPTPARPAGRWAAFVLGVKKHPAAAAFGATALVVSVLAVVLGQPLVALLAACTVAFTIVALSSPEETPKKRTRRPAAGGLGQWEAYVTGARSEKSSGMALIDVMPPSDGEGLTEGVLCIHSPRSGNSARGSRVYCLPEVACQARPGRVYCVLVANGVIVAVVREVLHSEYVLLLDEVVSFVSCHGFDGEVRVPEVQSPQ